jgi:C1A family cysteine protease
MARLFIFGVFLICCLIGIQATKPGRTRSLQSLVDAAISKSMTRRSNRLEDKLRVLNDAKQQLRLWDMYKDYYNKKYSSPKEEEKRFQIFVNNLKFITKENDHLKRKENSYKLGLNELSSLNAEEIRQRYTGVRVPTKEEESKVPVFNGSSTANRRTLLKKSLDYRSYMNPVENQGSCGSCYSFATLATIEAAYAIKNGVEINLSKQEIVDCSTGTFGCHGGWFADTCDYILEQQGLYDSTDYQYLYETEAQTCRSINAERIGSIVSYGRVTRGDEEAMKIALNSFGPLFVVISVGDDFYNYESGILDIPNCSKSTDHAVVVVGYGTEDGQDYWLIRNSWGEYWGDAGYVKMARNKDDMCGISQYVYYPII